MEIIKSYGGLKFEVELPSPDMPIEELPPPKRVILPFSDQPGVFCRPLVERGETVSIGQKIGEDPENRMPPVHAPVSGKVTNIDDYRFAEGGNTLSMYIESDEQEEWKKDLVPLENFEGMEPVNLLKIIGNAGVKNIPFETLPDDERAGAKVTPIKQFVINGIEHGFAGSIVRRLLVERAVDLLEGVDLIKRVYQPEKVYCVINEKHEDVIQAMMNSGLDRAVEVVKLDVYYPLGHPHLLFKTLFDKEIPCPGGTAIDMGVAFASVDTLIHASEAIKLGKPMIERYVTVSGEGINSPKNLKVRIGTPLKDLIEFCGGLKGRPGRIVLGNPLDGMAQFSLERPVLKDTRWLWLQSEEQVNKEKYRACINCGDCITVCPVRIMPNFLGKFCEFCKYEEAADQYDLFTCIECGLCAYVCPSRRPLLHFMKLGKWELSQKEKENAIG